MGKILRLPQVKDKVGLGKTTIYARIKSGDFPKPVKIGRISGWDEVDLDAWIEQLKQASRSVA
nr:AlpA family transcriptional regulator [uncultured Pseudogulbenkiania sp.]